MLPEAPLMVARKVVIYGGTGELYCRDVVATPCLCCSAQNRALQTTLRCAGFMGRLVALALAKEGLDTTVIVRPSTRADKPKLCAELTEAGIRLNDGDMTGGMLW